MRSPIVGPLLLAASSWAQAFAQGQVWIVDDDGPADFADLQLAIDTVASGDVLLVESGDYAGMDIVGKSLTIQADEGALVTLDADFGRNRVTGLSALQSVRLRGLVLRRARPAGLEISGNAGTVWIEECDVEPPHRGMGTAGVSVTDSASVVLVRTSAAGEAGVSCAAEGFNPGATRGGPGLRLQNSAVHAFGSHFVGGAAVTYAIDPGASPECRIQSGGHGISGSTAQDFLLLSDCVARGGAGRCDPGPMLETRGGTGLKSVGPSKVLDSVVEGGPIYHGGFSSCESLPGFATEGDVAFLPRRALRMRATSPVRENGTVELTFEGPPGVAVWVLGRLAPEPAFVGPPGSLLVRREGRMELMGFTDAAGTLQRQVPLHSLGPNEVLSAFVQALYVEPYPVEPVLRAHDPAQRVVLGEGSMIVGLDASF